MNITFERKITICVYFNDYDQYVTFCCYFTIKILNMNLSCSSSLIREVVLSSVYTGYVGVGTPHIILIDDFS